jgi:hypothetical protein
MTPGNDDTADRFVQFLDAGRRLAELKSFFCISSLNSHPEKKEQAYELVVVVFTNTMAKLLLCTGGNVVCP